MAAANTDKLRKTKANFSTTLDGSITDSDATIACASLAGVPIGTAVMFTIDRVDSNGTATPSAMEGVIGVVSGNNITTAVRGVEGTAQAHSAGAVVEILWTADNVNDLVDWALEEHNQDGTHSDITGDSIDVSGNASIGGSLTIAGNDVQLGWYEVSETWTRTGNHTFTVSGDLTERYRKGTKVRYKDGGAYEYGVIGASSFGGGVTTVALITNTSYAMAAATITATAVSYMEAPVGFPSKFDYTPSYGGSASMTYGTVTTHFAWWSASGCRALVCIQSEGTTGGTASNELTATLPIAATTQASAGGWVKDSASMGGFCYIPVGLTTVNAGKYDYSNFGLGTGRRINVQLFYTF
jgi:hypothetical protein